MAAEADAGEKARLRKLGRRLRSVHEELAEYSDLLHRWAPAASLWAQPEQALL